MARGDSNFTSETARVAAGRPKSRSLAPLRGVLPFLEYDVGERSETLRRDFGRTLTELFQERFLAPMREWAAKNSVLFRIQNYGEPPASLASSRHADLIDGEGWNFLTLTSSRWASSASHLFGKPVTRSRPRTTTR